MRQLEGRTFFITGASRGIGRAMALRFASEGANIVIAAKSDTPHPDLPHTIHSVAEEVESAGGQALAFKVDVRFEDQIEDAVIQAANHFGGIDVLINNASAIQVALTPDVAPKRYDLMMDVNVRGSFMAVQACLPYLKASEHAHILTMSPPINMSSKWLGRCPAYGLSKYGMSILAMGFAGEFEGEGICSNTLWPATTIDTSAVRVHFPQHVKHSRTSAIVADAAFEILTGRASGQHFIDEDVLRAAGVTDFEKYACEAGASLTPDLFLDEH